MDVLFGIFVIFFFFLILFLLGFFVCFFIGAPYVRMSKKLREKIWNFSEMHAGQTVLDLGSGDGVVLRELARHGAHGIGWEIHPILVLISRFINFACGYRKKIIIERKNFWKHQFPARTDVIILYGITHIMKKLGVKLEQELKPGTKIISVGFQIPNLKIKKQEHRFFLYIV